MAVSFENESLDEAVRRNVDDALREDHGVCDWTALLIPADQRARATVISRDPETVVCGVRWFEAAVRRLDPEAEVDWRIGEGDVARGDDVVCEVRGMSRALLSAERTALNFLQLLSGVATNVRRHVDEVGGRCAVLDTRKTLPGLRLAQKYAVKIGGGKNQRLGLYDGILIKENHIMAAGGVSAALKQAQGLNSGVPIQIEVETLQQLKEALASNAESILLDNFNLGQIKEAVKICDHKAILEVSGGMELEKLSCVADTGIDRISVGKLTKDVQAADFSWRFESIA